MNVSDFDFTLPPRLIAQSPVERGRSRLLVLERRTGTTTHARVADLPTFLGPGDLLVVNDTRVFPARLLGRRVPTGGTVECLLLGRLDQDRWDVLMHPGQKLRPEARVVFEGATVRLHGEVLERKFYGRRILRLWADHGEDVERAIDAVGHVPLPPYIKRRDREDDRESYQTVYARVRGSVAGPTAGLHFTPSLLAELEARGVQRVAICLRTSSGEIARTTARATKRSTPASVAPLPGLPPGCTSRHPCWPNSKPGVCSGWRSRGTSAMARSSRFGPSTSTHIPSTRSPSRSLEPPRRPSIERWTMGGVCWRSVRRRRERLKRWHRPEAGASGQPRE